MSEKPAESKENIWKTLRKPEKLFLKITLNIKAGLAPWKQNMMKWGLAQDLYCTMQYI